MPNKKLSGGHGVNAHGFDEAWVYYGGGADYFNRRTVQGRGPVSWWHNREFREHDEGYTDDLVTQYAIEFIRENKDRPFFCYVPFHIAHAPLQAKENDLAAIDPKKAANFPPPVARRPTKASTSTPRCCIRWTRTSLRFVAELDKLGLSDNTILVFTSDNGAMEAGSSLPLRGHKHTIYDGGVRLPTVIHWPKGGLVGGRKWDGLCGALDMFPTLMAMTGSKMPETRPLDGKNVWPALRDGQPSPVESYYFIWRDEDAIRNDRTGSCTASSIASNFTTSPQTRPNRPTWPSRIPTLCESLVAKMDAWADSLGAAISHRPAPEKYHASAAPEGEVLAVTVTITDKAKPKDRLAINIANWNGTQYATDWVEFDIAFSREHAEAASLLLDARRQQLETVRPALQSLAPASISSAAIKALAPASPTARASGNTASSASPAPLPDRSASTASSSPAARPARSRSTSTTSASATPTAAPLHSGPAAKTRAAASSPQATCLPTCRFAPSTWMRFANDIRQR